MKKEFLDFIISLSRTKKQIIIIFIDLILIELSLISAGILHSAKIQLTFSSIKMLFLIAPLFAISIFYLFGLYTSVIRFLGVKAFLLIFYAVLLYSIILGLFIYLTGISIPNIVLIYHENGVLFNESNHFSGNFVLNSINFLILLLLVSASRVFARQIFWSLKNGIFNFTGTRKNILIFGSGEAGTQLAIALNWSRELSPVAFIDENPSLIGKNILNMKVYSISQIDKLIFKYKISEILIAIPSINRDEKNRIVEKLSMFPVKVSILPSIVQIAQQKISIEDRKIINIEDVLGRESVSPNRKLMEINIKGKNVLITGAGGSIGSELCKQISLFKPKNIILYEQSEFNLYKVERDLLEYSELSKIKIKSILGDVCDPIKFEFVCKTYKVETIFHAAAYKHVPLIENNIIEAFKNNILGTQNCLEIAIKNNIKRFVLISTDKAVRPTNFMGATKRVTEMMVQALNYKFKNAKTKFTIVRFGNVLGSSGSVLPLFKKQISERKPLTVTHEKITRYFMTIKEAAQLVIQASAIESKGNIYVLDMGKPIRILDLAKKMVQLSGLKLKTSDMDEGDIEIKITGLRPGEKLFEELTIGNQIEKTVHPKINSISEEFIEWNKLIKIIKKFNFSFTPTNIKKTENILKEAVPEFKNKL